ncbi:relaxase/mobilization nuclease domain-containing protein [Aquimarina sp. I32.4]|uniref:relaxase/mobilization nuclease domain-containing protein n=1 Tax=Aquimarina sp. I32.4 TaxID=2053903 RepID=UPI000CDE8551|nr:relaxase/mobilization nuclease domain-containing protein [Aquimarina sp. I32.4]
MIPRINDRGYSFKGVTAYLMHDKQADTSERVAWTETGNLWSDEIHKAAKQMAWTDIHAEQLKRDAGIATTGRKTETGAVYHYSLAWAHEETPDEQHQKAMALETVKELGLSEHQYYFVAHNDTKHDHVHIVVNLTHPETGKRAELPLDKNKVQAWALEYEQERKIYCEQRVENARKRERGERSNYQKEKQDYSTQVTRTYYAADNGKAFKNALELEGLQLANGDRNTLVVVDEKGKVNRLMRQLKIDERGGAKTKAVLAKCQDLDRESLPQANELSAQIKEQNKPGISSFVRTILNSP